MLTPCFLSCQMPIAISPPELKPPPNPITKCRLKPLAAPPAPPTEEDAAPIVAAVFVNLDLLRKILLLLDTPPDVVRAALVSKDWLDAASDRAFLRQFGERSPPRLLGFLASFGRGTFQPHQVASVRFVPLPHPPEFGAAARLVRATFNGVLPMIGRVVGCRNGRVLLRLGPHYERNYTVRSPLGSPWPATVTQPSELPRLRDHRFKFCVCCAEQELLPNPGADHRQDQDAVSSFGETFTKEMPSRLDGITMEKLIQQVVYVRSQGNEGGWAVHISRPLKLPVPPVFIGEPYSLRIGDRICMMTVVGCIIVFNLATETFSVVSFPDAAAGVSSGAGGRVMDHGLARAGDSGIYLVHVKADELHVWFRRMVDDEGNSGIWERVQSVYLPVAFGDLVFMPYSWATVRWLSDSNRLNEFDRGFCSVEILAVGDNAEFVFLTVGRDGGVFLFDVKKRTMEKVLQMSLQDDAQLYGVCPFMMPWPPFFPALKQRG